MKPALAAATALLFFSAALYIVAGRWVAVRVRMRAEKADRLLVRAVHRSGWVLFLAAVTAFLLVYDRRADLPGLARSALLYAIPVFWLFAELAGKSWLELAAGRSDSGFLAFARFNVFEGFLLGGQRLPLVSAAFAMPADLEAGASILPAVALHLGIALALGLLLRWFVMHRIARVREFPDPGLVSEIRVVADRARVRLRGIRLVPTERGQSVNAVAATSSNVIYVAQGLREGLERTELKAVLLHELGHFRQPLTNRFRDAAGLVIPALVWLVRARPGLGLTPREEIVGACVLVAAVAIGGVLAHRLYESAEVRADRFAERWGDAGSLARALTKLYARNAVPNSRHHRGACRDPALAERLELLGDRDSSAVAPGSRTS